MAAQPLTGISDLNFDALTTSDLFGGSGGKMKIPESGTDFGFPTNLPSGYNPVTGGNTPSSWGSDLSSFLSSFGSSSPAASPGASSSGNGVGNWLSNFLGGNPANGGTSGLAPYLAAGAGGIAMAKDAQNQATKEENELKGLGQPYTDAGKQLLKQFQGGKLRPDQQAVVDTSSKFSSDLMGAATPLGQIAQQAFSDYNSGKLPAADELKLNNQIAAQKQQMRQKMASSGITDSSVMAAQDQQIDNQAMIARQDLLDKRFATGNQAYDQWLKTTNEGQQLKLQGQQFASTSFEQMLNDSLGLGSEGMQPAMQAIQLKIQSDAELSQTVSELLGNLASAYSYAAAGPKTVVGGGGGSSGGGGQSGISQIISGINGVGNAIGSIGKIFGFNSAGGEAAGLLGGVGKGLGVLGAGAGVYNAIDNWQSGDTGGDTLRGVEAGASLGSVIPGLGTAVGALAGGAVGAISSVFGPGKKAQETQMWDKYLPAATKDPSIASQVQNPYILMAGLFDEHSSTLPMYQQYGRMGEQKFTNDMAGQINQAFKTGKIKPGDNAQTIYSKVVDPWVSSMGKGWGDVGPEYTQATKGLLQQMVSQYISGQANQNWKARGGDSPFANLPRYAGSPS